MIISVTCNYISDMLCQHGLDQKPYWKEVKSFVRQIENESSVLSIDDFIIAKPYSSENDIIAYHYDHAKGKSVNKHSQFHAI